MNKKLRLILFATLIACVALAAVGCKPTDYRVTFEFDASLGDVSVNGGGMPATAREGSELTVTVDPVPGYLLDYVTVNGSNVTFEKSEDVFTFSLSVASDSIIKIAFKPIPAEEKITVTEKDKCSVALSAPANGINYVSNETITAKVTPIDGYLIKALNVNGVEYPVRNGAATFSAPDGFITVAPVYYRVMTSGIFAELQKSLHIEGNYTYDVLSNDEYDATLHIEVIFANNMISLIEQDAETGEVYYDYVLGKDKRNVVKYVRNINNEVTTIASDEYFEDYYNPFLLLSQDDFLLTNDGYVLADENKAKNAAQAITGYTESIDSFIITVDNGSPSRIFIKTKTIHRGEIDYISTYDFSLETGTASVPTERYSPYPHLPEHDALKTALDVASACERYIVRHQGHELDVASDMEDEEYYKDTDYNVYVVRNDIIYDSFAGEENGYKVLNGLIYPFFVTTVDASSAITVKDPLALNSLADVTSRFSAFKPELFKLTEESGDCLTFTAQSDSFVSALAPYFAEGLDETRYYAYAENISVKIKNGVLYQVLLKTRTYGLREEITLTYDFTTDFSDVIDSLDFESASKQSVLDPFKGDYRDSNGNFCRVDDSGFILNGIPVAITDYSSEQSTFVGTWKGTAIAIMKMSSKQLLFQSDDLSVNFILTDINSVAPTIPEEYRGVWSICNEEEDICFKFRIQSHVIWCNDEEMTVLSYDDKEGLAAAIDGATYYFAYGEDDEGKFLSVIGMRDDAEWAKFFVTPTDESAGVEIPEEFVGVYMDASMAHKVKISYSLITVNGVEYEISSFTESDGFVGRLGAVENYRINFYFGNYDKLQIGIQGDNYIVERVDSLNANYIGTWASTITEFPEGNEYHYLITITDVLIKITADYYVKTGEDAGGNPIYEHYDYENLSVTFSFNDYGYSFELPGSPYTTYLLYSLNDYGNPFLVLYDNNALTVVLLPSSQEIIPADYVGAWGYSDDAKSYRISLYSDGTAKAKLNTEYEIPITDGVFVRNENRYEFFVDGKKYNLIFRDDNGDKYINMYSIDAGIDVNLSRSLELAIPSSFYGVWKSSDGKTEIVIKEDDFRVKIDGSEDFVSVYYLGAGEETGYYTFVIDGVKFELEAGNYGENNMMLTYQEDGTDKYAYLSRQAE